MRIAIIIPDDFSIVWFSETIVKKLIKDHDVTAICDVHSQHKDGHYLQIMKSWGVKHEQVEFYRFFNPIKDLKYIFKLIRILRRNKYDKVINIATKPNLYGPIAEKISGHKDISTCVWGLGLSFSEKKSFRIYLYRFIATLLYKHAFKASNKVWFTNEKDLDHFKNKSLIDPKKVILTKNYVNTHDFSPGAVSKEKSLELRKELGYSSQDKVVILLARMSWAKGIKEFCESADFLSNQKNLKFLLVGPEDKGSADSVPIEYLKKYDKKENFKWIGFRRDVKELYSISDLAVYPSFYREGGYPRGLTEPMSMGKPVITTDSEHCAKSVDHQKSGLIIPIKDSKALANGIDLIMSNPQIAENYGKESRKKAIRELDEETIITSLIEELV